MIRISLQRLVNVRRKRGSSTGRILGTMAAPATLQRPVAWLALGENKFAERFPALPGGPALQVTSDVIAFLRALAEGRPRIAIVSMPPADPAVLDEVARERRRRPSLRVVLLAAGDAVETRLSALEAGFDDALPDTIDPAELAGRLVILGDRARRATTTTILPITASADLDLVAHELRQNGEPIHLRPKEFRLLAVLAAHQGRAFTRRQLLDRVWGPDHVGDPRTVDVHVRWLRAKIEPDPDCPTHLVTVRGVGYRLDAPDR
jgi:DNA-binding response OmpR family regulator